MPALTLNLTPEAMTALRRVKKASEAETYADTVCAALRLYDAAVSQGGQDARMVYERPDGSVAMVRLFREVEA